MPGSGAAIPGVFFDMDGVLCDSGPFICEAAPPSNTAVVNWS